MERDNENLLTLSQQVGILWKYTFLKFGSDFKAFLTKELDPCVNSMLPTCFCQIQCHGCDGDDPKSSTIQSSFRCQDEDNIIHLKVDPTSDEEVEDFDMEEAGIILPDDDEFEEDEPLQPMKKYGSSNQTYIDEDTDNGRRSARRRQKKRQHKKLKIPETAERPVGTKKGEMNQGKATRRIVRPRIKWTEEMIKLLLERIQFLMKKGHEFEKPTATEFYQSVLSGLDPKIFKEVSYDKIMHQMRNLRVRYQSALEGGEKQLHCKTSKGVLKPYRYFNSLHSIFR